MTTPQKTELQKTRGAFRRAFRQAGQALPAMVRANWRNIVMPWRMLPHPVALALIGLVALAMVLDMGEEPVPAAVPAAATTEATVEPASTIGGTLVPAGLDCAEDTVIAFTGIDTLDCVHIDTFCPTGQHVGASETCESDAPLYDTITLTLGEYVPGETPCAEDEIYDTVAVECIHIDRVAPRHTAQPTP